LCCFAPCVLSERFISNFRFGESLSNAIRVLVLDGVTSAIKQFSDVKHAFLRPLYLMQKNLQFLYSEANSLRDIDRKNSLTLLCRKLIFLTVCAFIYFARSLKAFVCKK